MASRNESTSAPPNQQGVELTNPTQVTWQDSGGGSSSQYNFEGIANDEAFSILMDYIRQTAAGGTPERKAQQAERNKQIVSTRQTLGDYTKSAAFADAADLMAQQLRLSLEKNMPAISKSIQGAGTSASSMQGLLSQKLATESAQSASALGAEQAKAYGTISSQLQGVLEALTRIDPTLEQNLIQALGLTKMSEGSQKSVQNPTKVAAQSGGGTYWQPLNGQDTSEGGGGGILSYGNQGSGNGQGYILNNTTGNGTIFQNGGQYDYQLAGDNGGMGDYWMPDSGSYSSSDNQYYSPDNDSYGANLDEYI